MRTHRIGILVALVTSVAARAEAWNSNQGTRLHGERRHGRAQDVVWFPVAGWSESTGIGWSDAQGKPFTEVKVRNGVLIPVRNGREENPDALDGATVVALATDNVSKVTYKVWRVSKPDPNVTLPDHRRPLDPRDTRYYTLGTPVWGGRPWIGIEPYCRSVPLIADDGTERHADLDRGLQAVPIAEVWNQHGTMGVTKGTTHFTMACSSGVIAKCYRWGYQGWQGDAERSHVQACTRMAMADYCGDGRSHTVEGTPIDLYDRSRINDESTAADRRSRGMTFETAWVGSPKVLPEIRSWDDSTEAGGALCLSKKRWDTIPLDGAAVANAPQGSLVRPGAPTCPRLANQDPRGRAARNPWDKKTGPTPDAYQYTPGDFCDYAMDGQLDNINYEALKRAGALLFNHSQHLDALLSVWTSDTWEHRTSSQFVDSGDKPGAPRNYPTSYRHAPDRLPVPLGSVFRVKPPASIRRGRSFVELSSYHNAAGDYLATTQSPPLGYTGGESEGWILPCVPGSANRPRPWPPVRVNAIPLSTSQTAWTAQSAQPQEYQNTTLAQPTALCAQQVNFAPSQGPLQQIEGHLPVLTDD